MLGFQMTEVMEGYHKLPSLSNTEYPLKFTADWGTKDVDSFLDPENPMFLTCPMKGTIEAQGICQSSPLRGYLNLNYPQGFIKYEFSFKSDSGVTYLFTGEKVNIRPWNLPVSHTTCFVTILNEVDQLVSKGVVFFKMKNALSFVRSLRLFRM